MTQPKIQLTPALDKWIPIGLGATIAVALLFFKYNIIMSVIVGAVIWFVFRVQMNKLKGGDTIDVVKKNTSTTSTDNTTSSGSFVTDSDSGTNPTS